MLELIFLSGVDRDQTRPRVLISSGGEKLLNDLSGVATCFCCHQIAKTSAIGGLTWAASTLWAATLLEIQQNSENVALFSITPWATTVWFNDERNTTGVYTIDRSVAAAHCGCWFSIILKSFHCQKWLLCFFWGGGQLWYISIIPVSCDCPTIKEIMCFTSWMPWIWCSEVGNVGVALALTYSSD